MTFEYDDHLGARRGWGGDSVGCKFEIALRALGAAGPVLQLASRAVHITPLCTGVLFDGPYAPALVCIATGSVPRVVKLRADEGSLDIGRGGQEGEAPPPDPIDFSNDAARGRRRHHRRFADVLH